MTSTYQRTPRNAKPAAARLRRGRPPKGDKPGVSHLRRVPVPTDCPLHVTVRLQKGLPSMRRPRTYDALLAVFTKGCDRFGMRLTHYCVMSNHIHMIIEADDRKAVSRGMKGLLVRIARALNRLWKRKGSVFSDRYHDRVLDKDSTKEIRSLLIYVLNNAQRHGLRITGIDYYSSGWWFHGYGWWSSAPIDPTLIRHFRGYDPPVATPRNHILAQPEMCGPIYTTHMPLGGAYGGSI